MKEYLLWLAKLITLVFVLLVIPFCILGTVVSVCSSFARTVPELESSGKNVAVVELQGEISNSKEVVAELYKQVKNERVKGIVLRIDSPGGAVAPSQDIFRTVQKLKAKKPIVVSMGNTAASGGLYSALAASKIYCQPGTLTGSIGVIMQIPNFRNIVGKVGVEMVTIKSGQFKDTGNMFREMTEPEKELLSKMIMSIRSDFVQAVVEGRGLKREDVEKFADGRVIIGSEAKELGLVDEFGDIYDAARAVFELLNEPLAADEYPNLYYPDDNMKKIKKLLEGALDLPLQMLTGAKNMTQVKLLYM